MRSRTDVSPASRDGLGDDAPLVAMAAVPASMLSLGAAAAQDERAPAMAWPPGRTEIARALETVKADPNLAHRTHDQDAPLECARPRSRPAAGMAHVDCRIVSLARTVGAPARVGRGRGAGRAAGRLHRPHDARARDAAPARNRSSHRLTCGISTSGRRAFPRTSARAARVLWDRGEHRAALALLYRGMLSRLAHVHRIPIRDSSTEGDCLALAASHLTEGRGEYASRLVRVWQRFVYGGQDTQAATVHVLCDDFAIRARFRVTARFHGCRGTRHDARQIDLAARRRTAGGAHRLGRANTYWADTKVPMPPKGEALTNPFYAVQRFAEALGARTHMGSCAHRAAGRLGDRALRLALGPEREPARRRSSAGSSRRPAGGRRDAGRRRARIRALVGHRPRVPGTGRRRGAGGSRSTRSRAGQFQEEQNGIRQRVTTASCRCATSTACRSSRAQGPRCGLSAIGPAFRRCASQVGRGSVTVINATPFRERSLFDGDHGRLFVAATELRRGDEVHFLSEDDHPSLLALLWQYGAPVVVLSLDAHRARAVARRRPVRAARGGAGRGPPLAGRADPRHGAVRAAPRRRRLASRGLRARPRRSGRSAGFRATRVCPPTSAPRRWRVSPASTGRLAAAVLPRGRAPLPRAAPARSRSSRPRGARSSSSTRGLRMEHIETHGIPAGRCRCSTICARPSVTRWSGSRRSSSRCWWRSSRRGTS